MRLDLDALNKQVEQKKHQQKTDMQQDKAFDKLRNFYYDQQDVDESKKRAALLTDPLQYWATQENAKNSPMADLKHGRKGAFVLPIQDGELGPASMQIFEGEGIGEKQKRREQMKKTQTDLLTQMEGNKRRHMGDKHREMLLNKELALQDFRGVQQYEQEEEYKMAARVTLDNYNRALAVEQAKKLKEMHRREERDNLAETYHTLTSDMMTECAEAAERNMGGKRHPILTDRWKGMNPEQLGAIHRQREKQRIEGQRHRDAEKNQNVAWELQLLKLSQDAVKEDRRAEELRRERRIQTDQYNMQLTREQQAHQEYLNKKLYINKHTMDYFSQFNDSSR